VSETDDGAYGEMLASMLVGDVYIHNFSTFPAGTVSLKL